MHVHVSAMQSVATRGWDLPNLQEVQAKSDALEASSFATYTPPVVQCGIHDTYHHCMNRLASDMCMCIWCSQWRPGGGTCQTCRRYRPNQTLWRHQALPQCTRQWSAKPPSRPWQNRSGYSCNAWSLLSHGVWPLS